ncbi:hypothetical protein LTR85_002489 [Meristemomyces frigidus]|nr:hypothetical protein LTR85_002489 [Meristemomyces frigidus]
MPATRKGTYFRLKEADSILRQKSRLIHFHERFTSFFNTVFKPKFGVTDHWFQYEFQGRGNTHVHGFAWFDPEVAPKLFGDLDEAGDRAEYTRF